MVIKDLVHYSKSVKEQTKLLKKLHNVTPKLAAKISIQPKKVSKPKVKVSTKLKPNLTKKQISTPSKSSEQQGETECDKLKKEMDSLRRLQLELRSKLAVFSVLRREYSNNLLLLRRLHRKYRAFSCHDALKTTP